MKIKGFDKNLCCRGMQFVPFQDKYGLTDLQTLRIAREEMSLMEMLQMFHFVKER